MKNGAKESPTYQENTKIGVCNIVENYFVTSSPGRMPIYLVKTDRKVYLL